MSVAQLREKLDEAFPEHIQANMHDALFLSIDAQHATGGFNVASKPEADTLARLKAAVFSAQREYNALHPDLRAMIHANAVRRKNDTSHLPKNVRDQIGEIDRRAGAHWPLGSPDGAARELATLADALAASITAVEKALDTFESAGQTNWRGIAVLNRCRAIWQDREGMAPPESINEASGFGKFAQGIFNVLAIGSARAANNARIRVQT